MRRTLAALALVSASAIGLTARSEPAGPRLLHVPAGAKEAEQGVLTPVPISLEVPRELPARRVLLHYHVFGASAWRTLELRREGTRYAGAIPCLEVGEMTREVRYYIRVHDAEGAVVAFSGTRASPYRVAVHHPSARPDLASVARCPDPVECPPGLPGCPSEEVERLPCQRDRDCEGGLSCGWDHYCGVEPRRKNWLGVGIAQSIGVVATQGACAVASQENEGYACYRQRDGAIYTGRPLYTNEPAAVGLAPTRLVLSYERLLFYRTSLGVRASYAFAGSGPTLPGAAGFVPFSGEVFARYWLNEDPFASPGVRPFLGLGAGFSQSDVKFTLRVREDTTSPALSQGGNDLEQRLRVWKRAGDAMVSASGGALYAFSEGVAAEAEVSVCQTFPYSATLVTASAGVRVGFR